MVALITSQLQTWTIGQHGGPNRLGLWSNQAAAGDGKMRGKMRGALQAWAKTTDTDLHETGPAAAGSRFQIGLQRAQQSE